MSNPGLSQIKQTDQTYKTCITNTNKFKHTNKQHSKQTLLNPNGAIEARVGGRETKMVRAMALLLLHKVKSTGATSRSKSCRFERSAAPAAYGVRSNAR